MSEFILILGILFVLISLFIVLLERKMLPHAQRRMGPCIMGRNGWLQLILDLLKLVGKESFILPKTTTSLVPFLLAIFYATQL
jgi:NADH:ubiquinone oxidoreductase subunit H